MASFKFIISPFNRISRLLDRIGMNIWPVKALLWMMFVALFADFLANELPLFMIYNGDWYFPVIQHYLVTMEWMSWKNELANADWRTLSHSFAIWPPIPYLPENIDIIYGKYLPPLSLGHTKIWHDIHLLGTDGLGRDILAGLIHGTRTALMTGLISMFIASIIGITSGAIAGFYGDHKLRINRFSFLLMILSLIPAWFYAFEVRSYVITESLNSGSWAGLLQISLSIFIFIIIILLSGFIGRWFNKLLKSGSLKLPADLLISRLIEVFDNVPVLFLIISIAAIAKPGLEWVILVIGLTSWTMMARFTRSEFLKIRELDFIASAKALGFSDFRIIFRHALPNAAGPILVTFAFGASAAILIESSLSFLGIGVPVEDISWGSMLSDARKSTSSWWLAVFPGFGIFFTVWIYNLIGEHINGKSKNSKSVEKI